MIPRIIGCALLVQLSGAGPASAQDTVAVRVGDVVRIAGAPGTVPVGDAVVLRRQGASVWLRVRPYRDPVELLTQELTPAAVLRYRSGHGQRRLAWVGVGAAVGAGFGVLGARSAQCRGGQGPPGLVSLTCDGPQPSPMRWAVVGAAVGGLVGVGVHLMRERPQWVAAIW